MQSILVFLDIAKFADSWWKIADASRTQGGGLRDLYIFEIFLSYGKFHDCRICVTDFRKQWHFCLSPPPHHPWAAPKKIVLKVHSQVSDNSWQLKALLKWWKILFILPQSLLSFSRYLNFYLDFLVVQQNGLIRRIKFISQFMTSQSG